VTQRLVKNEHGDYFIQQWNPQPYPSSGASSAARSAVLASPQFDGPRGIGNISPFTTFVADERILANGMTGWVGVDITGRVVEMSTSGHIETIHGPRSVAGVVQTDHGDYDFGLSQRLAANEKETVGGNDLIMPQDLAVNGDFVYIADTGAGAVKVLDRLTGTIRTLYEIPDVSSVWYENGMLCATAPDGVYVDGVKRASISNAFWGRMSDHGTAYILTKSLAIYEFDPTNGTVIQQAPAIPSAGIQDFVFMVVDRDGLIGPQNRIYFSGSVWGNNKSIQYVDPDEWLPRNYSPGLVIRNGQSMNDQFGHYMWGMAIHREHSQFITVGISNDSWKLWTAHLRDNPTPVTPPYTNNGLHPAYRYGAALWSVGIRGEYPPMAAIFDGFLGFSPDAWRNVIEVDDIEADLDEILPLGLDADEREYAAWWVYWMSTRPHFLGQ
jgi:hypothetical protein